MLFLIKRNTNIKLILFTVCTFLCSLSANVFGQDFSISVKEIRGFAFIERRDKTISFSVFRGSEIKENSLVKTDSKSQVILSIVKDGNNVYDVFLNSDTIVFVNKTLFNSEGRISISLLQGRIKIQTYKEGIDLEVHSANASSFIKNGDVEMAIAIDGSGIIYSITGNVLSITDIANISLRAKDIYIIESDTYNFSRSSITPDIFINTSEDKAIKDIDTSLSKIIEQMKGLNNQFIVLDNTLKDAERQSDENLFIAVEVKAHRLLSANEGYYHSATKLLDISGAKSRNAFEFTKTINNLYFLNNKYIDKINLNLERNKARIERTKKLY